eukprot:314074-Chlamydomonas_euryale.AAC.4
MWLRKGGGTPIKGSRKHSARPSGRNAEGIPPYLMSGTAFTDAPCTIATQLLAAGRAVPSGMVLA